MGWTAIGVDHYLTMDRSPYGGLKFNDSLEGRMLSTCPGEGELGKLIIVIVRDSLLAVDLLKIVTKIITQEPTDYQEGYIEDRVLSMLTQTQNGLTP